MKIATLLLIFVLSNTFLTFSQDILNNTLQLLDESVQQIAGVNNIDIQEFQNLNNGSDKVSIILQQGNQNKLSVNQSDDPSGGQYNQVLSFQIGNENELTLEQSGYKNLLLSFQIGYLALGYCNSIKKQEIKEPQDYIFNQELYGERNKLLISQEGNNNEILAIQMGDDNYISADQKGTCNYLWVLQKGNFNSVTDYRQENNSDGILFDSIIQEGDNLSITTDGVARNHPSENIFAQTGSNLSINLHNAFLNTTEGVEVSQSGKDMKVVIDQSYFPNPLK